jgi:hypothetical protein
MVSTFALLFDSASCTILVWQDQTEFIFNIFRSTFTATVAKSSARRWTMRNELVTNSLRKGALTHADS